MKILSFSQFISLQEIYNDNYNDNKTGKHWGKVAAGVIIKAQDTDNYLVAHRSNDVFEPNTWSLTWGGKIDGKEQPLQAAMRELDEELGVKIKSVIRPKLIYTYKDKPNDFTYYNFLVVVEHEFIPKLNWETQDFEWCKLKDIPNPKHFGTIELLKQSVL